jgi:hypothetical protein
MGWTLPTNPRSENQECLPGAAFLGIPFALADSAMSNTRAHYFRIKTVERCRAELLALPSRPFLSVVIAWVFR